MVAILRHPVVSGFFEDLANDIVARPQLLDKLEIEGAIVTIDAIGCQRPIARRIVYREGEHVLALKDRVGRCLREAHRSITASPNCAGWGGGPSRGNGGGEGDASQRRCAPSGGRAGT